MGFLITLSATLETSVFKVLIHFFAVCLLGGDACARVIPTRFLTEAKSGARPSRKRTHAGRGGAAVCPLAVGRP